MRVTNGLAGIAVFSVALVVSAGRSLAAPKAYVTSPTEDKVSVIDTGSDTVLTSAIVSGAPTGVAVNPAGTRLYVTKLNASGLAVLDTANNGVVATVPVASLPVGVAVNPAGTLVYVGSLGSSVITPVDPATNLPGPAIVVGNGPVGVAFHPTGTAAYVTNTIDGTVSVINVASGTAVATIPVGVQPEGVVVHPSGAWVYVANYGGNSVSVIDAGTNAVLATVPVGAQPAGVAVSPDGTAVYVVNSNATVSVIDPLSNTVLLTIPVGDGTPAAASFFGLSVNPAGTKLYAANEGSGTVSVINAKTHAVQGSVPTLKGPVAFGAFIGPCATNADCSDGNVCTDDTCDVVTGRCAHAPNAAPCDDQQACTVSDVCSGSVCAGAPQDCNDSNVCTTDSCTPATGECAHVNNSNSCNDGNACTTNDGCVAGSCVGGPSLGCDDGNGCTDDGCNPATGCTHVNNTAPCSDGNACTTNDACTNGSCAGGGPLDCSDPNPCTDDSCSPVVGCVHSNNTATCSDGNACTDGDACANGSCVGGGPLPCDDGNPCTDDACDPASGCTHTNNSAPCNDANVCTTNDTCSNGACAGGPAIDCNDGNVCTDDICDSTLGCLHANNSLACSDGNACTTTDVCVTGTCVGGNSAGGCSSCDAAANIPSDGGTFVGTTSGVGSLTGGCGNTAGSPERVYRWVPPTSGVATIYTCGTGTGFDTVVYLRSATCTGSQVACNDDSCTNGLGENRASRITPTVTAGQPYYIVVDGYNGAAGTFTLTVSPPSTCGNNVREGTEQCDGVDHAQCPSGLCTAQCRCVPPNGGLPDMTPSVKDLTLQFGATVAAGDVAEGCAEATSGVDLLRFTVESANVGTADFQLGNPGCPSPCTAHPLEACGNPEFICSPAEGHNHAHYNNYARYELLDVTSQAVVVGHKQGFCMLDSAALCANPVYTCTNQGVSAGCADRYSWNLGCQYLDITGLAPGAYTLRVSLDPFGRISELNETNNVVDIPVAINVPTTTTTSTTSTSSTVLGATTTSTSTTLPPAACQGVTIAPPEGGVFTGATSGASSLAGTCGASGAAPEQVYQWTPTVPGVATIQTCGSGTNFDSVLYMRDSSCASGVQVACSDDACANSTGQNRASRITPSVIAGKTYYIVVDGYNGKFGSYSLTITPPGGAVPTSTTSTTATSTSTTTSTTVAPGPCQSPGTIPAGGGTVSGTTSGAGALTGSCGSSLAAPEKVFAWTPATSGVATIETCGAGTGYDTVLYVRGGTCTGSQITCNDDACANASGQNRASRITPAVTAGQTYFIVVDGYNGSSGTFTLKVTAP